MHLPQIESGNLKTIVTDKFYGYRNAQRVNEGEFTELVNFSADEYPALQTRKARYLIKPKLGSALKLTSCKGMAYSNGLTYVDAQYVGGQRECHLFCNERDLYNSTAFALDCDTEKRIISMGAYIVVFPDMKYVNVNNPETDAGSINVSFSNSSAVKFSLCTQKGAVYQKTNSSGARYVTVAATEPTSPKDGAIWLDTCASVPELKKWYRAGSQWVTVTAYVKLAATSVGTSFSKGDDAALSFNSVSDASLTALAGTVRIEKRASGYLVFEGIINDVEKTVTGNNRVSLTRQAPLMDFVVECSNRLWGCRYGTDRNGNFVNEIYCSKLGDFKNWACYEGISTDAWACAVGSDGAFTGAVCYDGYPIFFKENLFYKIYISSEGAHRVVTVDGRGIQNGSDKSVAKAKGVMYYKAADGIYAYDGGSSVKVSDALGDVRYTNAVGGACGGKYYVSMNDEGAVNHLFVYDIEKGLWHEQAHRSLQLSQSTYCYMAEKDGDLFCVDSSNYMWCITGKPHGVIYNSAYADTIEWAAQTGYFGYGIAGKKYISRLCVYMYIAKGSAVTFSLSYDNDEEFSVEGQVTGNDNATIAFPLIPRRCERMRLRIEGQGKCIIYSISKTTEIGSEL